MQTLSQVNLASHYGLRATNGRPYILLLTSYFLLLTFYFLFLASYFLLLASCFLPSTVSMRDQAVPSLKPSFSR